MLLYIVGVTGLYANVSDEYYPYSEICQTSRQSIEYSSSRCTCWPRSETPTTLTKICILLGSSITVVNISDEKREEERGNFDLPGKRPSKKISFFNFWMGIDSNSVGLTCRLTAYRTPTCFF